MTIAEELRRLASKLRDVGVVPVGVADNQLTVADELDALAANVDGRVLVKPIVRPVDGGRYEAITEWASDYYAYGATEVEALANLQALCDKE